MVLTEEHMIFTYKKGDIVESKITGHLYVVTRDQKEQYPIVYATALSPKLVKLGLIDKGMGADHMKLIKRDNCIKEIK